MNFQEFKQWVLTMINQHPDKKKDIAEFYYLALNEIEDGGSEQHEINLAMNDINELIK